MIQVKCPLSVEPSQDCLVKGNKDIINDSLNKGSSQVFLMHIECFGLGVVLPKLPHLLSTSAPIRP